MPVTARGPKVKKRRWRYKGSRAKKSNTTPIPASSNANRNNVRSPKLLAQETPEATEITIMQMRIGAADAAMSGGTYQSFDFFLGSSGIFELLPILWFMKADLRISIKDYWINVVH